ncbi:SusC/RagA family TonB-linked outer membrane protein [Flavihumibacter profundi]|uniref:SusC/RagA family TonB-linked outer membrane protein n=1 Tax=Flavihumibacter profundi TaxID=2716883 RepID=UPI001CC47F36|nr:SusC/RagA family TonB-linked outer membrane protein [Flavihumibacter profundi]MBZ5857125.1 SusC/RagA family TonB-linked outer membrane protein [Flavihumibacter profundi]
MRKLLSLVVMATLLCGLSFGQAKTVTGKVTDDKGQPIPFATVKVKDGKTMVTADAQGDFKINVDKETAIIISSAGFGTKEVSVEGVSIVSVKLTGSVMEEVIVTAGGLKSRRKELGSATTQVKGEVLNQAKATNVAGGLQGKVAGFQISGTGGGVNPSYRLVLRGQRSLTGNNQALVVLDNVVVPNTVLGNLNPEDVEDIVVLNGAGAAALYGSQASNGAVIVTTKKGKKGVTSVSLSQTVTQEQVAFFPKIQREFGAGGTAYGVNSSGDPVFNYLENQSYGPRFDGVKRPLGPPLEDGSQDSAVYAYNDGHNKFWEKGLTSQTDFSVSNGDENSTFYLSGQYVSAEGTTPADKYNRTNVRINGTRRLGKTLMFTYSSGYTQNRYDITTQTGSMYGNMLNMPSNVDITKYKNWQTDKFANPNGFYNPWYQNPYFTKDNYRSKQRNDYLTANIELKYTPIQGLDFVARQGISTRNASSKNTVGAFNYTTYAENTDQSSKSDIPASVSDGMAYTTNLVTDLFAQYNKRQGDFNFGIVAGGQFNQNQSKYVNVAANGLIIPDLFNVSNGVGTPYAAESNYMTRQYGAYGKINIGYKNFLFLQATGRNDWDSRLAEANRSFFYPSIEGSFIASDAIDMLHSSKVISYLKVRGGWSKTGNVNLGDGVNFGAYQLMPTYSPSNGFPYGTLAGYGVDNGLVSNNLRPEITKGFEAGFDLNLFSDRFTSTVTFFNTKTDDQTVRTSISTTTGFSSLLTNTGQTQSKGAEVTAHVVAFRNKDWNITVGGNYTYLENNVNYISADLPKLSLSAAGSGASYAVAGYSFPVIMGFDYKRTTEGKVIVDATTGLPSKTDQIIVLGNATPRNRLSLDGQVRYKNFRLAFLFEHRAGYKIFNSMGTEMDWSGTGFRTAAYDRKSFVYPNSVYEDPTKPGVYIENKTVAIANGNGNNGFWTDGINRDVTSNYVTNGDFWKLRELSISYDIPAKTLASTKVFKGATISLQGRNLFLWMAKDNLYTDPEYSTSGVDNNGVGITGLDSAPPSRFYGATISLKF